MSEESIKETASLAMPHQTTILNACKIAIAEDRPIMLDYWNNSLNKDCFIGVRENDEKLLVKNEDEDTQDDENDDQYGGEYEDDGDDDDNDDDGDNG